MDPAFGLPEKDDDVYPIIEAIDKLVNVAKVGGLKSSATRILMRETYDSTYQLYTHTLDDSNVLASIILHDAEDCSHLWGEQLRKFAEAKIGDHWKISFDEFIKQTPAKCEEMIRIGMELLGVETRKAEGIEKDLKAAVNSAATRHTGGR